MSDDGRRVLIIAFADGQPVMSLQRPTDVLTLDVMLGAYLDNPDVLAVYVAEPVRNKK